MDQVRHLHRNSKILTRIPEDEVMNRSIERNCFEIMSSLTQHLCQLDQAPEHLLASFGLWAGVFRVGGCERLPQDRQDAVSVQLEGPISVQLISSEARNHLTLRQIVIRSTHSIQQ